MQFYAEVSFARNRTFFAAKGINEKGLFWVLRARLRVKHQSSFPIYVLKIDPSMLTEAKYGR